MKAVILKHLPRFDKGNEDIIGVKPSLSAYANNCYDQLWLRAENQKNIHILEIDIKVQKQGHLKDLIYGKFQADNYDGVHLRGSGAKRHFNYRAKQAIRPVINSISHSQSFREQSENCRTQISHVHVLEPSVHTGRHAAPFLDQMKNHF